VHPYTARRRAEPSRAPQARNSARESLARDEGGEQARSKQYVAAVSMAIRGLPT
jgi:hypothetical protein